MNNEKMEIKSEMNIANINNVIELVEKTQYSIFNNEFEYNTSIPLSDNVPVDGRKKFVNINRELALTLDDEIMFRELTPFDRAVHNAVCSLCYSGIDSFTTEQVYKILIGDSKARLNNKTKANVEESLKTLRNRFVIIKFEDEGEHFKIHLLTENGDVIMKVSNYILPLSKTTLRTKNGQIVDAWNLLTEPPLLSYARIKKQIETIAIEQLQIPLSLTEGTIKLREFLLKKILLIKRKTLRSGRFKKNYENCNILKFEDIYELFGFDRNDHSNKSSVQKKRLIEKCEIMLNYWMNETGMLAKWIFYKNKDGEVIGYKIKVNLNKFKLKFEDIWDDEDSVVDTEKESEKLENNKSETYG